MRVITRMSKEKQLFDNGEDGPCACSHLRRVARKLTTVYDRALLPAGITVTQYALLVNVARAGTISRTELAQQLGMDRTTLTRNLGPIEQAGLLIAAKSADRRERLIQLSKSGLAKTKEGFALWRKAQRSFAAELGPKKLRQLRNALEAAEEAAG